MSLYKQEYKSVDLVFLETMDETNSSTGSTQTTWRFMGRDVPKGEIVYFCQTLIILTLVVASLVNISLQNGNTELWITLLSSSAGYVLPNPSISKGR